MSNIVLGLDWRLLGNWEKDIEPTQRQEDSVKCSHFELFSQIVEFRDILVTGAPKKGCKLTEDVKIGILLELRYSLLIP